MTTTVDTYRARAEETLRLIDRLAIPASAAAALRHSLGGVLVPPSAVSVRALDERGVLDDVVDERVRQDRKWGEQNHPDGTGDPTATALATYIRDLVDVAALDGSTTWAGVLAEEVAEAFAESNPPALRTELVQVAAVAVQWVAAIDRRGVSR